MGKRLESDETRQQIETIKAIFADAPDWETAKRKLTCGVVTKESAILFLLELAFVIQDGHGN